MEVFEFFEVVGCGAEKSFEACVKHRGPLLGICACRLGEGFLFGG